MARLILLLCSLGFLEVHAVGYQHGVFRSQATQGPKWTGTATIIEERFVITVFPDYLDVEMDWEFAIGGTKPEQYEKALEIVGNINLEAGASIIGLLAWYQGKILKGKLKSTEHARKDYEEVVDRNSPVPPKPRDPVLVERSFHKDLRDNYDISIFPVEWGGTRKVRIRYLVPATAGCAGYPHAFTQQAKVVVKLGHGIEGYLLHTQNHIVHRHEVPSLELHTTGLQLTPQSWNYLSANSPRWIQPILPFGRRSLLFKGPFSGRGVAGLLTHAYLKRPAALLEGVASTANLRVFATLRSGPDSLVKEVHALDLDTTSEATMETLRIYSHLHLDDSISWSLHSNGALVKTLVERPIVIAVNEGLQYGRTFGMVPFYPLAKTMPRSLGVVWGFVDDWYSLVALETDALPDSIAARIAEGGLPALEPTEFHPEKDENYAVPTVDWIRTRKLDPQSLLGRQTPRVSILPPTLPPGIRLALRNGRFLLRIDQEILRGAQDLECSIHGLDGRLIRKWRRADLGSGTLSWSPEDAALGPGTFILKIDLGQVRFTKALILGR